MKIIIRSEQVDDYDQIKMINDLAFGQPNEGRLVEQIRVLPDFIPALSLVAQFEGKIIGHILFSLSEVRREEQTVEMLCLAPMAVLPKFQNHKVGTMLVEAGLSRAKGLGYQSVNVLGHKKYYPRFGFKPASQWEIFPPFEVPEGVFMAMELVDGALDKVAGVVHYAEPFNEV